MKLIIGAMQEELQDLINDLKLKEVATNIANYKEYVSADEQILVVVSGIGITNAASALTYAITKHNNIEFIINIGTAGTFNLKLHQGDIFAIDKATYSFANATVFGYDYGQVPQMPSYYSSNADLIKQFNLPTKNLATSDVFVSSEVIVNQFINQIKFPIELVEMEGTSYMQVAHRFNIPIISIKIVSDILNGLDNALSHDKYVPITAKQISKLIREFIK